MKKYCLLVAILLIAFGSAACGANQSNTPEPITTPQPKNFVAEGHLVPKNDLTLAFLVRGKVDEILVAKEQTVSKGQVLIRLADREQANASLAGAQLEQLSSQQAYDEFLRISSLVHAQAWSTFIQSQKNRAAAERAWERLDLNAIKTAISDAQAEVNSRKADLDDAQKEFDKYKSLDENNASRKNAEDHLTVAQNKYNEALRKLEEVTNKRESIRAALNTALAAEVEAKRNYDRTSTGPDPDKKALLEARLNAANAQLAAAQKLLDGYELKAPFDGVITDINLTVGQQAGPETWAISLADFSQWYVDTSDLSELDVVKIQVGQEAQVAIDALPDLTLVGIVEEIGQTPRNQAGDILYTVHILVKEADPRFRWGMTVEVTFPDQ